MLTTLEEDSTVAELVGTLVDEPVELAELAGASLEDETAVAELVKASLKEDDGAATLELEMSTAELVKTSLELEAGTSAELKFKSAADDEGTATELDDSAKVSTEELWPKSKISVLDEYVDCCVLKSGAVASSEQFTKAMALATIMPFKIFDFILCTPLPHICPL